MTEREAMRRVLQERGRDGGIAAPAAGSQHDQSPAKRCAGCGRSVVADGEIAAPAAGAQ